jgi:hypothetical protein
LNDELAAHLATSFVGRHAAVEDESTGAIGAELDRDTSPRRYPLRNSVLIDREAVRNVLGDQGDPDDISSRHLDA